MISIGMPWVLILCICFLLKGLHRGHCNTLKKTFFENLYFLVTNVLSVSKLILPYLNLSSIDLATLFNIEMYLLNREKRYKRFSEINRYNKSFKWIANR